MKFKHSIVLAVIISFVSVGLSSADVEPTRLRSPDGRSIAYISKRPHDTWYWYTIWVSRNGRVYDLLPGEILPHPGTRTVWLGIWLDNKTLTFQYHCGTGCVGIYKINVINMSLKELWTGNVDGAVHWSPRRDRAVIEAHLGGLLMLRTDGRIAGELLGCQPVGGEYKGYSYAVEKWLHRGALVKIRKVPCYQLWLPSPPTKGESMIWDGKHLTHF
ncbi:MAG: hypothetical protein ACRD63_16560 [Pyrinomonadaceae bacterium]